MSDFVPAIPPPDMVRFYRRFRFFFSSSSSSLSMAIIARNIPPMLRNHNFEQAKSRVEESSNDRIAYSMGYVILIG